VPLSTSSPRQICNRAQVFYQSFSIMVVTLSTVPAFCCHAPVSLLALPLRRVRWRACASSPPPATAVTAATKAVPSEAASVLLSRAVERAGVDAKHIAELQHLCSLVLEVNQTMNLTAVRTADGIIARHLVDGLGLLPALDTRKPRFIADVGTGAGFPGLVIAVCRPDWQVTLVEAALKKTRFHQTAIEALGLENVQTVWARAEEIGHELEHRESYDVVVARAVAEMRVLAELTLPLVRVGGCLMSQKSVQAEGPQIELNAARFAINALGGELGDVEYAWTEELLDELLPMQTAKSDPQDFRRRAIITVNKIESTDHEFPRVSGTPKKNPL
jgi:16S rRNA (guanine527-N7)-methyltransferase